MQRFTFIPGFDSEFLVAPYIENAIHWNVVEFLNLLTQVKILLAKGKWNCQI